MRFINNKIVTLKPSEAHLYNHMAEGETYEPHEPIVCVYVWAKKTLFGDARTHTHTHTHLLVQIDILHR